MLSIDFVEDIELDYSLVSLDPMRVLYSKSSSPKMSVDINHPDMNEVKKVRVEKTLEVPVGEVVPLAKTSRTAVPTSSARGSVMVGNEIRGSFSEVRASVSGTECTFVYIGSYGYHSLGLLLLCLHCSVTSPNKK